VTWTSASQMQRASPATATETQQFADTVHSGSGGQDLDSDAARRELRFKTGIASQVPIVPVAIHGTGRIWPPGRSAIHAGRVCVAAASPLRTTGLTQRDVARLREQARDAIRSAHRELVAAMPSALAEERTDRVRPRATHPAR
jgi:hypothetical protein